MPTTASNSPTQYSRHRFHLLDGLRGLAALLVVLWHANALPPTNTYVISGYLAVDFFFCLSGFVIAFSYARRFDEGMPLRSFVLLRIIRLYPMYLLGTLAGFATFLAVYLNPAGAWIFRKPLLALLGLNLLMIPHPSSQFSGGYIFPFDSPAWSLFIELLGSIAFGAAFTRKRAPTVALASVAIASSVALFALLRHRHYFSMGYLIARDHIVMGLLRFILSFTLGILVFRLMRILPRFSLHGWSVSLLLCGLLVVLIAAPLRRMDSENFRLLTAALLFPGLVFLAAHTVPPRSWLPACVALGEASYPLYLLHLSVLVLIEHADIPFIAAHGALTKAGLACVVVALLAASYAIARWIETPLRKHLTRFANAHRWASPQPPKAVNL